ncbi:MFS transporter [Nocardioides zeae]|uniref:MFS transporter n=1 Tax=Nocardioides imazamoxiresistens TaxID=3231893 RepID=A0ABU3PSE3_9ACTN|nr:MFS transporter [Nocardioides zeae]MDT9592148.1 MFS transporter [Nocardioides zeae]
MLAVAVCSFALMQSLTVPVLARIAQEYDAAQSTVTWVLTGYLLAASVATPIAGRLGDVHGKRRVLVVSLGLLCAGSLLAAVAPSVGVLIAARVVQGLGGGVVPLSFGIVRDRLDLPRVPGAIGLLSSLIAVGTGAAVVVAGPIIATFGFAALFLLPAAVTGAAAVAARLLLPDPPRGERARLPLLPAVLLAAWLVALLLGVTRAPVLGWTSAPVLALLGGAVVVGGLWVRQERRGPVPLIDLRLLARRPVWTVNVAAMLLGGALYAFVAFAPQLHQTPTSAGYGLGATVTGSGLLMLPYSVATFVLGLLSAPLARRFGGPSVAAAGCLVTAAATALLAVAHDAVWQAALVSTLVGVGNGLAFACLTSLLVASSPPEHSGVLSGMNANLRTIGGSVGTAVVSSVVTARTTADGLPVEGGYVAGFLVLAVALVAAAVVARLVPTPPRTRGGRL